MLRIYDYILCLQITMIYSERRIVKFGKQNIREDIHLIQTVLFCDLWKKPITDSVGFVLDYSREMVRSSSNPLNNISKVSLNG